MHSPISINTQRRNSIRNCSTMWSMGYTSIRLFLVGILLCIPWYVGFELAQNKVSTQQTAILESKAMHNSILPLRSSEESTQQASVHTVKNSDTNKNTVHPAHQALLTHHQKSVVSKSLETLATTTEDTIMLSDVPSPKTSQKMGITPGMTDGKFSITEILDAQNIARAEVGVPSLFGQRHLHKVHKRGGIHLHLKIAHSPMIHTPPMVKTLLHGGCQAVLTLDSSVHQKKLSRSGPVKNSSTNTPTIPAKMEKRVVTTRNSSGKIPLKSGVPSVRVLMRHHKNKPMSGFADTIQQEICKEKSHTKYG
jgi:hypothetical protein